jgi:hypothetical protein
VPWIWSVHMVGSDDTSTSSRRAAFTRAIGIDWSALDLVGLRLGALLGAVAPTVSGTVQRGLGAGKIADEIARGQRSKG